ncbi:MAG: TonB-dependent receptor [Chitinophagaceae bacterium]|nr:MAG: TonB-dependent receptor [Chitinophagaceae bacterium]
MKKIFTICYLLVSAAAMAQVELKGIVKGNEQVMAGATISLNKQHTVMADSAGRFLFTSLAAGKYSLQVTMSGYDPYFQNITIKDSIPLFLTIDLQSNASSLDAVVVSGTMKSVRRLESPIAVEVYSHQFFKKNPSPSVFEALSMVNGVRPQINCNVCNTGDIHINGLEGPYTMVTIDGMPIVSSLSSVYGLFGIPSQMIERVEVVKGPASGLYGSEAIGGLINIITKSPQKAPLFSANLMSTTWKEHLVDLGAKWKVGNALSAMLGVNYFNYSNPLDVNGDNFTDVTLQHRISVFNKWTLQRPLNRIATLAGRYFYEDRWGGEMQWTKVHRGGHQRYGESIYTKRWELIGNYQLPVQQNMFFAFSATGHNQDSYYGITPFLADQKIIFGQATWDKNFASQSMLIGLAGRYNYYDDNSTATFDTLSKLNQPDKVFLPGIFLQDEWKINSSHRLLFGLRYDHHPFHKSIFTPRIAYKWAMSEEQVLRLNAGTGFRVVNLFTEEHAALTGARGVEIRETLAPEKSYNINLNYNRKLGSHSKAASLDVSAWYTYFHNQIIPDYDTDPNKIIYDNLKGYAVSKGVSANLEFNFWQRLKGNLGATLQDVAKYEETTGRKLEKQKPVLTESWSGNWAVSYAFPLAGLTIDYTGNIYGPMRLSLVSPLDPRKPTSPVWSLQNIQLTKWFSSKFEIYAGIKNLLHWTPAKNNSFLIARANDPFDKNVQYDATGNVLQTPDNPYALTFDPAYVYAPNQGRRVFLGFRVNIRE